MSCGMKSLMLDCDMYTPYGKSLCGKFLGLGPYLTCMVKNELENNYS